MPTRRDETHSKLDLARALSARDKDDKLIRRGYQTNLQQFGVPEGLNPSSANFVVTDDNQIKMNDGSELDTDTLVEHFLSLDEDGREALKRQDPQYFDSLLKLTYKKYPNLDPNAGENEESDDSPTKLDFKLNQSKNDDNVSLSEYEKLLDTCTGSDSSQQNTSQESEREQHSKYTKTESLQPEKVDKDRTTSRHYSYILIDFRKDIIDLDENGIYSFNCPDSWKRAQDVQIQWLGLPDTGDFTSEPYIYISIPGANNMYHSVKDGNSESLTTVLVPKKNSRNLIFYEPVNEHEMVSLESTTNDNNVLKIGFMNGLLEKCILTKLNLSGIRSTADGTLKIVTSDMHYLSLGDQINMTIFYKSGLICVYLLTVSRILDSVTFQVNSTIDTSEINQVYLERKNVPGAIMLKVFT